MSEEGALEEREKQTVRDVVVSVGVDKWFYFEVLPKHMFINSRVLYVWLQTVYNYIITTSVFIAATCINER